MINLEADLTYLWRCRRCGREWSEDSLPPAICERNHEGQQERLKLVPLGLATELFEALQRAHKLLDNAHEHSAATWDDRELVMP